MAQFEDVRNLVLDKTKKTNSLVLKLKSEINLVDSDIKFDFGNSENIIDEINSYLSTIIMPEDKQTFLNNVAFHKMFYNDIKRMDGTDLISHHLLVPYVGVLIGGGKRELRESLFHDFVDDITDGLFSEKDYKKFFPQDTPKLSASSVYVQNNHLSNDKRYICILSLPMIASDINDPVLSKVLLYDKINGAIFIEKTRKYGTARKLVEKIEGLQYFLGHHYTDDENRILNEAKLHILKKKRLKESTIRSKVINNIQFMKDNYDELMDAYKHTLNEKGYFENKHIFSSQQ